MKSLNCSLSAEIVSFQLSSHSSAISRHVFHIAPEILGVQGTVVFIDICYGTVGLEVTICL